MSEYPEDIMKLAKALAVEGFADYFNAPDKIAAALMAERERCAVIARKYEVNDQYRKVRYAISKEIMGDAPDTQKFDLVSGQWVPAIPEPYYHGLVSWLWLRLTGYRDDYGRKARLFWER